MRLYRDRAVVLRQHKLGEADRIVTLLTREHGLVRAVAKGVRRTRSKFGSRLEPFAHIDVQLHPGRNLDIVTQVQAIDAFASDIVSDYGRYPKGLLVEATKRIEKRLGPQHCKAALEALEVGDLRAVALITLRYYDKAYLRGTEGRDQQKVLRLPASATDLRGLAQRLKDHVIAPRTIR